MLKTLLRSRQLCNLEAMSPTFNQGHKARQDCVRVTQLTTHNRHLLATSTTANVYYTLYQVTAALDDPTASQ